MIRFTEIHSSHNRKVVYYFRKNIENIFDHTSFFETLKHKLVSKLNEFVRVEPIKFNLKLMATYHIPNIESFSENRAFKTSARIIFTDLDIEGIVDESFTKLTEEEDRYQDRRSGFIFQHMDGIFLGVYNYRFLGGHSYIALPAFTLHKHAIINPSDIQYFKWSILAKRVTGEHLYRVMINYNIYSKKINTTSMD